MKFKEIFRNHIIQIHKLFFIKHYYNIIKLIEPNIFSFTKKSFGKKGDGSYILPHELITNDEETILLSFGISNDISFEQDFNRVYPKIKVFAFDPTIDCLPEKNSKIQFFKVGLAGSENKRKLLLTIDQIFERFKLNYSSNYIFKIDIEGWEWEFLEKLDKVQFDISILTIELHFLPLTGKQETLLLPFKFYKKYRILQKIKESFYIYHVHANNYQYINFRNFKFPTYLELTLINKNLFVDAIKKDIQNLNCPTLPNEKDNQFPFIQ